jgi:hypothetical protein
MAGVTKNQWSAYVREIFRITKPGTGWAQIIEPSVYLECDDDSVPNDAAVWEVNYFISLTAVPTLRKGICGIEKQLDLDS